jgi:hypothetical protein
MMGAQIEVSARIDAEKFEDIKEDNIFAMLSKSETAIVLIRMRANHHFENSIGAMVQFAGNHVSHDLICFSRASGPASAWVRAQSSTHASTHFFRSITIAPDSVSFFSQAERTNDSIKTKVDIIIVVFIFTPRRFFLFR